MPHYASSTAGEALHELAVALARALAAFGVAFALVVAVFSAVSWQADHTCLDQGHGMAQCSWVLDGQAGRADKSTLFDTQHSRAPLR